MNDYYTKMMEIYNRLCDEESKILFNARISYLFNRNITMGEIDAAKDEFLQTIDELYEKDEWHALELQNRIEEVKPKGIIIFGCGHDGLRTYKLLTMWGYDVAYFCDNYRRGEVAGIKILSLEEMLESCKEYLVIIASTKYGAEMFIELVQRKFPSNYILLPKYNNIIWATRGKQYFDVFEPQKDEVFIDAGTYGGETILEFSKWAGGKYKKIYGFEPMHGMCEKARQTIEENCVKNTDILNCAAWNRRQTIYFAGHDVASYQSDTGEIVVQGVDIDSVVGDEKVTFIKMDIEGSELKALEGARNTILKSRPRLAISIYHKPMDVIDIPVYLLKLIPEYKFHIRHYESHFCGEEVIYASL